MSQQNKKKKDLNRIEKFQAFMQNSKRIFKISTKPTRKQFLAMTKICVIGLVIIGLISFVVQLIASVIIG